MNGLDNVVFGKKKVSDILEEIYTNQQKKDKQISILISELKPLVQEIGDATLIVPLIKEYLEISVKNDEQLIKMATIIQRCLSNKESSTNDLGISEAEKDDAGFSVNFVNLDAQVERFRRLDDHQNLYVLAKAPANGATVLEEIKKSVVKSDHGWYGVAIPWKENETTPNNIDQERARLLSLAIKFRKDWNGYEEYAKAIESYEQNQKGYVQQVPKNEIVGSVNMDDDEVIKPDVVCATIVGRDEKWPSFTNFCVKTGSLRMLFVWVAWIRRFVDVMIRKMDKKGPLYIQEINDAEIAVYLTIQRQS